MSIYGSSTTWGGQCSATNQSPINLSQSSSKPCDSLCDLVFDDAYIPQANCLISDEGLILQSTSGLGSIKFNGEGYTCTTLLVTHPSHHTIENIQADAEVLAIFTNPTGKMVTVSSLVRVNPHQTTSTQFFNAFVPYANPSVASTPVNLGDNWGLFMMAPPAGSFFVYDGSLVVPPCTSSVSIVFKAMINIDSNEFALLVKNVSPGSRPIQTLGNREVFFNDQEQLPGGPMPHDNKTYMRCKRTAKKGEDAKPAVQAPLATKKTESTNEYLRKTVSNTFNSVAFEDMLDVIVFVGATVGAYYAAKAIINQGSGGELIYAGQYLGQTMNWLFFYIFNFLFTYILKPIWNFTIGVIMWWVNFWTVTVPGWFYSAKEAAGPVLAKAVQEAKSASNEKKAASERVSSPSSASASKED